MNLCCAICAETVGPSDELNGTQCGHMFHVVCLGEWLGRSKTCPQCRARCTSSTVIRMYMNVSLNETVRDDPLTLQNANDQLKLRVRSLEAANRKSTDELETNRQTQKMARRTIVELEAKLEQKDMLIVSQERIHQELKLSVRRIPQLEQELVVARTHNHLLDAIQSVLNATVGEVEKMMQTDHSIRSLATMVVVLKREIRASEQKRHDMRKTLVGVQAALRRTEQQEAQLQSKISSLESDLSKALEDNRTMVANNGGFGTPPLIQSPTAQTTTVSKPKVRVHNNASSSTSNVVIAAVVDAADGPESPYLRLAASSLGLAVQPKHRPKVSRLSSHSVDAIRREANAAPSGATSVGQQFSIFKKARLTEPLSTVRNSNRVFNGLGGTDRRDMFAAKH